MRVTVVELWGREGMLHYTAQLCNSLARLEDVQMTVLLPSGTERGLFDPPVAVDYVDVVMDATVRELALVPIKLARLPRFYRAIRMSMPDVLHLNNCHVWHILTLPWLRRQYPIVSTMHDVEPHPEQDDTWRKHRELDALARQSDGILVHGEGLKQRLLARYPELGADRVTVVPLGDFSFLTRYSNDVPEEQNTVLFFGRIRDYKGLKYLLRAAPLVAQRLPDVRFVIAGYGDMGPYRSLLTDDHKIEIHNRYIPDEDVAGFFRAASIVALPYIEASQSAVIPIAYAFGKPVVATLVGSLPDVVSDGETGYLVPPRDVPQLATAIVRLLEDKPLRETMGQNAYQKMRKELDWDRVVVPTIVQVYQEAISEFGGHA